MIPKREHWHVSGRSGFFRDQAGRARLSGMTRARARTLFHVIVRLLPTTAKPESRCIGQSCPLFEFGGQTRVALSKWVYVDLSRLPRRRRSGTVARWHGMYQRGARLFVPVHERGPRKKVPVTMVQPILPVPMNHDLARRAQSYVTVYTVHSINRTW
jgi:hypothetical protein